RVCSAGPVVPVEQLQDTGRLAERANALLDAFAVGRVDDPDAAVCEQRVRAICRRGCSAVEIQPKPQSYSSTGRGGLSSIAPPAVLHVGVARPRVGRPDREQLGALGAALEAAHRVPVYAQRVEGPQLDDLVLDPRQQAPADHDVDLFLVLVPVSEGDAEVRRDALVADALLLELQGHARHPRLDLALEPEVRRLVLDVVLQVQLGVAGHLASSNRRNDAKARPDEAASRVEHGTNAAAPRRVPPASRSERLFRFWRRIWTRTTQRRSRQSGSGSGRTRGRSTSTILRRAP